MKVLLHERGYKTFCILPLVLWMRYGLDAREQDPDSLSHVTVKHGNKGVDLHNLDDSPAAIEDFSKESAPPVFKINRARLKVGGHAFQPSQRYYWEYELGNSNLLDFRIMVENGNGSVQLQGEVFL